MKTGLNWTGSSIMGLHSRLATGPRQVLQNDNSTSYPWHQFNSTFVGNQLLSPSRSLFFISGISCLLSVWNSLKVWLWRIREISPFRHLLRLSSAVSSGRRFEHCCCFVPTPERENSSSSVFWLLLSTTIYNECNGTEHSNWVFEHNLLWNFSTSLNKQHNLPVLSQ